MTRLRAMPLPAMRLRAVVRSAVVRSAVVRSAVGRSAVGRSAVRRPPALPVAGIILVVVGVLGLLLSHGGGGAPRPAPEPAANAGIAAASRSAAGQRGTDQQTTEIAPASWAAAGDTSVSVPVELTIPAIGVRTSLVRLGRTTSGALEVPGSFTVAGWYDLGPRPGEPGPAVIAGHVDSVSGPAVFYRLGDLRAGDRIYVLRADGSTVTFEVTGIGMYPKDEFPADSVYGPVTGPQLRLITCGGTFDYARRSYLSNVVVYATETT